MIIYRIGFSFSLFLVVLGFTSACKPEVNDSKMVPSEISQTLTPSFEILSTQIEVPASITPEPTILPTNTLQKSTTPSPTALPPSTLQPEFTAVIAVPIAVVRIGPADVFPEFANLAEGLRVRLLGRDETGAWYLVDLRLGQTGWVPVGALEFEFDPQVQLPEIASHPEIPTLTPTPAAKPRMILSLTEAGRIVVELIDFPASEDATFEVFDADGKLFGTFTRQINYLGYLRETLFFQYTPKEGLVTIVATSSSGVTAQNSILLP